MTWLLISGLFGLWHLGYVDQVVRVVSYATDAPLVSDIMLWKVAVGWAIGLLAGLVRWGSGRVYGPFLVHALWNLFGR